MIVGLVSFDCIIYDSHSLKDKRSVLQRIITRLKQRYNVSVSELDFQDVWQRTKIGIVTISSSQVSAERELQHALKLVDSFPEIERTITQMEWL